jgi:hypothetical protein
MWSRMFHWHRNGHYVTNKRATHTKVHSRTPCCEATTMSSLRSDARIRNHPRMQRTISILFQSFGHEEERREKHQCY